MLMRMVGFIIVLAVLVKLGAMTAGSASSVLDLILGLGQTIIHAVRSAAGV